MRRIAFRLTLCAVLLAGILPLAGCIVVPPARHARVWVGGHWAPHRVWVPGHWRYR